MIDQRWWRSLRLLIDDDHGALPSAVAGELMDAVAVVGLGREAGEVGAEQRRGVRLVQSGDRKDKSLARQDL